MSGPKTFPVQEPVHPRSLRWTGLLLVAVAVLSACDPDYPTTNWTDQDYDHAELSGGFELTGPHEGAACTSCHASGDFEVIFEPETNQDCLACHSADFEAQHSSHGYPTTCLSCHDGSVWERGPFDHEVDSGGFELWGPHAPLDCVRCHEPVTFAPRYAPTDNQDCVACH